MKITISNEDTPTGWEIKTTYEEIENRRNVETKEVLVFEVLEGLFQMLRKNENFKQPKKKDKK